MPKIKTLASLLLLGLIFGCGDRPGDTSATGPPPPHNGLMLPLPDNAGFVEVVKKDAASPTTAEDEASFYFYKDGTTPFSPSPTAGSLTVGEGKKIDLVAKGDALVTPPGPALFGKDEVNGLLTTDLGGKPVSVRIGAR